MPQTRNHWGGFLITILLAALAVAAVLTIVYVFGRLVYDAYRLAASRRRDKGDTDLPPLWRDVQGIGIAVQVFFLVALILLIRYLWGNFTNRTEAIGQDLSFDFLDQPSGITIADNPLSANSSVASAIIAGFGNTLRIIMIGIPLALFFGTLIGMARLSTNWLLRKIATGYVEFFRNIPVLVVIVFVWQAVFLNGFPRSQESWKPLGGWLILNNNTFAFPSIKSDGNVGAYQLILLAALLISAAVWWWRTRVFDNTGQPHRRVLWSVGTFLVIAVAAYLALKAPIATSKPSLDDRGRVYTDGIRMQMPYAALTSALVLYTASHISEIVRGSIQAVDKGQVEAGNALALSVFQRYRFVVLPQAMRIAFPPLINQFLNFTKNSSLAVAIGFSEVTAVIFNLFGQSQPSNQLILILMLFYLVVSLVISALGNVVNRRLQIAGR